ncbi:MAG: alpha/beta fold hydrolase [Victivallales bacterium]|jgi:pimeloyl-ACP methyl ester carboxylesterase
MKTISLENAVGEYYPAGLKRLEYASAVDGLKDWALLLHGERKGLWIIFIHGHGSNGDQLFTRRDLRETWLPVFRDSGAGILCANLRGNAWMGPSAADDMQDLLNYLRAEHDMRKTIFCSGSMGGTSNLIYAVLHPEDVNGLIIRGAASDLASYYRWCRSQKKPIIRCIAEAIKISYGGTPDEKPDLYLKHSAIADAGKLTMPLFLVHGGADEIIPVEQARSLAGKMKKCKNFSYTEIPGGNHDSPLLEKISFTTIIKMLKTD